MMNPAVSDGDDDPRNQEEGASNDENDTSDRGSQTSPSHELDGRPTEPFGVESHSSTDTYTYRSSYICCCCCNWLRQKIPALDRLRNNWKILAYVYDITVLFHTVLAYCVSLETTK
mmetsp:Transcript_13344/g.32047  ORF Transcript_13344/g.32047 Transcript_13344/m.32047 type:complete len:116 (+) Transcript_13344:2017-2364(+)